VTIDPLHPSLPHGELTIKVHAYMITLPSVSWNIWRKVKREVQAKVGSFKNGANALIVLTDLQFP
jgi:hypothetical protein